MKYCIIGIEKCGTTSLEHDLKEQGHKVKRWEWSYCFPRIRDVVKNYYPNYIPVMILRDPIDRCFSDYRYAVKSKQIPDISYEEALEKYPRFSQGSCYKKWVKNADIIFDMSNLNSKLNQTQKEPMTPKQITLTKQQIDKSQTEEYQRDWCEISISELL